MSHENSPSNFGTKLVPIERSFYSEHSNINFTTQRLVVVEIELPKVGFFRIFDNFLNFGKLYLGNHKSLSLIIYIVVFRIKISFDWYQFCYRIRGRVFHGTLVYKHLALAFSKTKIQIHKTCRARITKYINTSAHAPPKCIQNTKQEVQMPTQMRNSQMHYSMILKAKLICFLCCTVKACHC